MLQLLRKNEVVEDGIDPEELEEIVGKAVEQAVGKLVETGKKHLDRANQVLQVYKLIESQIGDKSIAVELTKIVFCEGER